MKRKKSTLYLILAVLFTGNILFTGTAANFFHDHESHRQYVLKDQNGPELHESPDDCLICGLDLMHELYLHTTTVFNFTFTVFKSVSDLQTFTCLHYCSYSDGRAPPSV